MNRNLVVLLALSLIFLFWSGMQFQQKQHDYSEAIVACQQSAKTIAEVKSQQAEHPWTMKPKLEDMPQQTKLKNWKLAILSNQPLSEDAQAGIDLGFNCLDVRHTRTKTTIHELFEYLKAVEAEQSGVAITRIQLNRDISSTKQAASTADTWDAQIESLAIRLRD